MWTRCFILILDQMSDILLHSERRCEYDNDESLVTTMNERVHLKHSRYTLGSIT